jgi:tRNA A37 N6-isopentenylltransferase MiaA
MNKLLIVCGLTATGKTDLGVNFARKYKAKLSRIDQKDRI